MTVRQPETYSDAPPRPREIGPGTILVDDSGRIKIIRSRMAGDDGWNCADGAGLSDADADDASVWRAFQPEELAADLALADEVRRLGGHRALAGGLATWDACSGRPCQLPKLAKLVN